MAFFESVEPYSSFHLQLICSGEYHRLRWLIIYSSSILHIFILQYLLEAILLLVSLFRYNHMAENCIFFFHSILNTSYLLFKTLFLHILSNFHYLHQICLVFTSLYFIQLFFSNLYIVFLFLHILSAIFGILYHSFIRSLISIISSNHICFFLFFTINYLYIKLFIF